MKRESLPVRRLLLQDGNVDMTEHTETAKYVIDGLSIITVIGTLAEMLPSIAALFTIVWTAIRIWETQTVQGWINGSGGSDAEQE
jgi:hypothetical protein